MNLIKKIRSPEISKWIFLLLLIGITTTYLYYKIKLQIDIGPISDTFDFLADAAFFAGKGFGYTDLNRPPILPFLTSIFFIFNKLSIWPIFLVDGILYVFGCAGAYLFFRERFDPAISFIGSLLFATFPLMLTFVGVGYNDVSGVAVAVWAIYITYLAVNRNSKYFLLSFPMAMLAFLTRFNMALIIFPIFLYILMNKDKIKSSKYLFIGMILGLLILIPVFLFYHAKFGNPLYPFLSFFSSSGGSGYVAYTEHFAYNPDSYYFLKNMPYHIGNQSSLIIIFTAFAFAVYLFRAWKKTKSGEKELSLNIKSLKINIKLPLLLLLAFLFFFTFGKVHYMISEVIFFVLTYIAFLISQEHNIDLDMDLLYFSWFMAFFIFQSVYLAKDHRYVITMYAPMSYFLVRGLNFTFNELKFNFKKINVTKYIITCILLIMIMISLFTQIQAIEMANQNNKIFNKESNEASIWLINYDSNYKSKVIYADFPSYFAWYLQMNVRQMPIIKDNQTLYVGGIKDYNLTETDYLAFKKELERISPDYFFSTLWNNMNFTSEYEPIRTIGNVTIFKRIDN